MKPSKNPPHRPSKYKPEYCEMLIDHMASGFTFGSFVAKAKVCEDTLFEWLKVHHDFSESYKIAKGLALYYWENVLIMQATGTFNPNSSNGGNVGATIFWLKAQGKWRDKDPSVINNNMVAQEASAMTIDEDKQEMEIWDKDLKSRKGK